MKTVIKVSALSKSEDRIEGIYPLEQGCLRVVVKARLGWREVGEVVEVNFDFIEADVGGQYLDSEMAREFYESNAVFREIVGKISQAYMRKLARDNHGIVA
jgi:hypothetical protein